mmetsp:Transcript_17249/g.38879  ORF Transcript_17249/g.38879 Transcript_17249/m.38879 type:complete len:295 (+) Transcript_17249:206-1090(+)
MAMDVPTPRHNDGRASSSLSTFDCYYEFILKQVLVRMFLASQVMDLSSETRFTGLSLMHRYAREFYTLLERREKNTGDLSKQDDQIKNHLGQVAAACIFLGCKMAEEPRRIRDVINLSHVLSFSSWEDVATDEVPLSIGECAVPPPLNERYWKRKEEIVSIEQHALRTIHFNTIVDHPYRCILLVMETLCFGKGEDETQKWLLSPEHSQKIILRSWRIINEVSLDASGDVLEIPVMTMSSSAISIASEGGLVYDATSDCDGQAIPLPDFWWRAIDVQTDELYRAKRVMRKLISS